ncbi:MAG: putative Ig domain-containing protein [Chthoniobacterales bacterium]
MQTDGGTEAMGSTPYYFDALVPAASNGSITGASISLPAGSAATSPQALSPVNDGIGSYNFAAYFADQATLNSNYADGTYSYEITGASSTTYNASLSLTGDGYPSEFPIVSNTTWSGGNLMVNPFAAFTLNWNSFADGTGSDIIYLAISNIATGQSLFESDDVPATVTSQSFVPNFFQPNQTYDVRLFFLKVSDTDTTDIANTTGFAGYETADWFTIQTIPEPPTITSPLVAMGTVNIPFSYQFEASGATSLFVDPATLPSGLTFDASLSAIVGNPTGAGTFQVALSASNDLGTTNATLVLTVQPLPVAGPVIMSATTTTGRTGSPFVFQVITSGGSSLTQLSVTGLPAGLTADPMTGQISGTVTTDGSFSVTLSATDLGLTNTATMELTFTSDLNVPVITSAQSVFAFSGLPFSFQLLAPTSDSTDPVTYSNVTPLPAGLGLDPTTGVISGSPNFRANSSLGPLLAGGIISNSQLFACNSSGCGAQNLFFATATGAANISTRLSVGTGDNVGIAGFITQGNGPSRLILRGIGPSLPVNGPLADPFLELHSGAATIASNDNWMDNLAGGSQKLAIEDATYPTGMLAPTGSLESAILSVLTPGPYTAILRGANNETGVGLVEVYDLGAASLDESVTGRLANISTRGNVQTGDNVMIGGFINEGSVPMQVVVRGIGPSLTGQGVTGALANPVLELHEPDGTVITNDDWQTTQEAEITATTLAPTNPLESAILVTLPVGFGTYTAIVRGANNTTGVALVEAYFGNPCLVASCP